MVLGGLHAVLSELHLWENAVLACQWGLCHNEQRILWKRW